ncbi:MAG: ACP S-malonyltransferase [Roseburia sp.]|nr:ACP S-malonyltransferase [Roseburia sp.]
MGKTAFLFPGQGAQYIGMGEDLYRNSETARRVFGLAKQVTGLSLEELCFRDEERINETKYTQLAILTVELAFLSCLQEAGITADAYAGLSLGEYAAVVASGAMAAEDAFALVQKRGLWMQEAYPQGGAMSAVLGLEADIIEGILKDVLGTVSIANYNCPGQIVITGEKGAVELASTRLAEAGAKRCVPLKVSGPFHSVFMEGVGSSLLAECEKLHWNQIQTPYFSNVTAKMVTDEKQIPNLLAAQVSSPVRFEQSIRGMIDQGIDTFVEVGPGKTLSSFLRKIDRKVSSCCVGTQQELEAFRQKLKEGV